MIKQHKAHLLSSVEDLAYIMRWEGGLGKPEKQAKLFVELNEDEKKLMNLIKEKEQAPLDWLLHELNYPLSELSNILLQLEFKGLISSLPGKKYSLL